MMIDEKGAYASTPSEATRVYERGLNGVIETGTQAGIGVVILQNIPEPDRLMRDPSILNQIFPSEELTSFDASNTLTKRTRAAEVEVSAANRGTVLHDPFPVLCPPGTTLPGTCPLKKMAAASTSTAGT